MSRKSTAPQYGQHVTRSSWPDPAFMPDLAAILGLDSESAARRWVGREGIPHLRIGRRLAVRANTLRDWLASKETGPRERATQPPIPTPPEWAAALLRRGRRLGLSAQAARRGGSRT